MKMLWRKWKMLVTVMETLELVWGHDASSKDYAGRREIMMC